MSDLLVILLFELREKQKKDCFFIFLAGVVTGGF